MPKTSRDRYKGAIALASMNINHAINHVIEVEATCGEDHVDLAETLQTCAVGLDVCRNLLYAFAHAAWDIDPSKLSDWENRR